MASYWDRLLTQRMRRRRALAASGGLAVGAAILSACGGGGEEGGGQPPSGVVHKPVDTTKSGKHGGTWLTNMGADPANFDLHNFNASLQPFSNVIGSQLIKVKAGRLQDPELAVEGDIAQSWEYSPDKLTLTIKLHPQAKWAPLSPSFHAGAPASIAGRTIDADDVLFSWERFKSTATAFGRLEIANEAAKAAPVSSLTKIDDRTVQMKLVRPSSALIYAMATWNVGYFYLLPKEGRNNAIDFLKYSFGAGPYYIDKYQSSVGMTLKRNPYFELRDQEFKRPFVDVVDLPIIADQAQRLAQFRTGKLFNTGFPTVEETLKMKSDLPELLLIAGYVNQPEVMQFGSHKDSPWKDVRVRQAMSYAWNRNVTTQIVMGTDKLEAAGIPANVRWSGGLSGNEQGYPNGTYKGWWLDPKSKDFGENAKYFQHNPTEAKALLRAAGYPNGLEFDHLVSFGFAGTFYAMDILEGVIADAGFKGKRKQITAGETTALTVNQAPDGTSKNWGNWVGVLTGIDSGGPDPASYIHQMYYKEGGRFLGYNPNSTGASIDGDPTINGIVEKLFLEFDDKKRMELGHEFQRYWAKMIYRIRYPGCASTVAVWWPAVQNLNVWIGESLKRLWTNEWIDQTQPPFKKA